MAYPNRSQIDAAALDAQHQLNQIPAQAEQTLTQTPAPTTAPNTNTCPGRNTISAATWYGWPECLICLQCFYTFASTGSLAHPSAMPLWGARVEEPSCCDMYSPRQRGRYTAACQSRNPAELLEASRLRAQVWEETMLGLARLDALGDADVYMAGAMAGVLGVSAGANAMMDSYSSIDASFGGSAGDREEWRTDTGNVYGSWNGVLAEREQLEADGYARVAAAGEGEEARRERERLEVRWKEFE